MRYLVLSDIHSNINALEACVRRAERAGYDSVLCCGDIVGYGPDPAEVLDYVEQLQSPPDSLSIRGNHDRVVAGLDAPTHFNSAARQAVEWTRQRLSEPYLKRLAQLPVGPVDVGRQAQLVHGSAQDEDEYVVTGQDGLLQLASSGADITFFGHTHEPGIFTTSGRWAPSYDDSGFEVARVPAEKILVNPGSVGQPRDGDPRASFLIWDSTRGVLEFYRSEYAIEAVQARMRSAGLPEILIVRLSFGR